MKPKTILTLIALLILFCCACKERSSPFVVADSKSYPYDDTVSFGIKSDSEGHTEYALLKVYVKYIGKDTSGGLDGSPDVKIGNRNWHVVSYTIQPGGHH
jgi:hypothetical protein